MYAKNSNNHLVSKELLNFLEYYFTYNYIITRHLLNNPLNPPIKTHFPNALIWWNTSCCKNWTHPQALSSNIQLHQTLPFSSQHTTSDFWNESFFYARNFLFAINYLIQLSRAQSLFTSQPGTRVEFYLLTPFDETRFNALLPW